MVPVAPSGSWLAAGIGLGFEGTVMPPEDPGADAGGDCEPEVGDPCADGEDTEAPGTGEAWPPTVEEHPASSTAATTATAMTADAR